jgi:uncharacterized membrane protein
MKIKCVTILGCFAICFALEACTSVRIASPKTQLKQKQSKQLEKNEGLYNALLGNQLIEYLKSKQLDGGAMAGNVSFELTKALINQRMNILVAEIPGGNFSETENSIKNSGLKVIGHIQLKEDFSFERFQGMPFIIIQPQQALLLNEVMVNIKKALVQGGKLIIQYYSDAIASKWNLIKTEPISKAQQQFLESHGFSYEKAITDGKMNYEIYRLAN